MSLHKKITLTICTIIILTLISLSTIIYIKSASILNSEAERYMLSQLERAQENIDLRVKINKLETEALALDEKSIAFLEGKIRPKDMNKHLIQEMAEKNRINNIYKDFFILNTRGIIVATTMIEAEDLDLSNREYFLESKSNHTTVTSDILIARSDGSLIVITVSPIMNSKHRVLGYAGIAIKAEYYSNIVRELSLGETGYYSIVDSNNMVLAHKDKSLIGKESVFPITKGLLKNNSKEVIEKRNIIDNGIKHFQIYKLIEGKKWVLIASLPTGEMYIKSIELLGYVLFIGIFSLFLSILVGVYVSNRISKPIVAITKHLDMVTRGNLQIEKSISESIRKFKADGEEFIRNTKEDTQDEIGNLKKALNNMKGYFISLLNRFENESERLIKYSEELAITIEDSSYRTAKFISTLSHDLKTSITLIKGYAKGLKSEIILDKDTRKEFLEGIEKSAEDIERITCDILDNAYDAQYCPKLTRRKISAREFTNELYEATKKHIKDSRRKFLGEIACNHGLLYIDDTKIKRAWYNIVNNAIKFSKEGKTVEISMTIVENKVRFKVKDKGIGIKEEEKSKIFNMFYKGDEKNSKGYGLGLFIAKSIIEAHNSVLEFESQAGVGTIFWFDLEVDSD